MAAEGTVARPYAQAAFELAHDAGQLGEWLQFLNLGALAVTEPAMQRLLRAPRVEQRRLADVIAGLCREQLGSYPPLAENFLRVLIDNDRLASLPQIAARFEELKSEAENILEVTLTSATEISSEQRNGIEEALKKRFGRQIRLTVALDTALLGGARLQVGDRVIDGTVRTGLDKLATALRA